MKTFETPYVEVIKFAVEDIITVSGETDLPEINNVGLVCLG